MANNTVVLSNGAIGTVTNATSTALTVSLSTKPTAGSLTAVVTTNGVSSGTALQVALINPVVTSSTIGLALNGTSLVINGFGFSTVLADNTVAFSSGVIGAVTAATTTLAHDQPNDQSNSSRQSDCTCYDQNSCKRSRRSSCTTDRQCNQRQR